MIKNHDKTISRRISGHLLNPNAILFMCMLISIQLLTGIGFHNWHGSHLTPHLLGVSLNLSETNLLCNSLQDGCDSYHRHPPLYFYVNYYLSTFAWSTASYINLAMTVSIIFNYIGIFILMQVYGSTKTEKFFIIILTTSTFIFIVNLTLSSYDSLILLIFSMYAASDKYKQNFTAYFAIFLSMTLSWYFVLAGTIYTLSRIYRKNYKVIYPVLAP